jgi:hypothetical protein
MYQFVLEIVFKDAANLVSNCLNYGTAFTLQASS